MSTSATIIDGKLVDNGVSAAQQATTMGKAVEAAKRQSGGTLDKDAFLQLLVAQMKYQDPLEPTENTEYVSQLASFSTLEEMQNMSSSMDMQRASGLVGQYVFLETETATGQTKQIEGTVDYVSYSGSKVYLSVGGTLYNLDDLKTVADPEYTLAVKLADTFAGYIAKLPNPYNLTDDNAKDVKVLIDAYSSMDSYQKGFLTDDEKAIYNAYAEWYKVNYSESEEDDSDKVNKSQEEADKDSKEDEEATKA